MRRSVWLVAVCLSLAMMVGLSIPVLADEASPQVIEAEVLGSVGVATPSSQYSLALQGTSWVIDGTHAYVLTFANFSPFDISSLSIMDRYLPLDPEAGEHISEWSPDTIAPYGTASMVITLPGPWPDACHQIEVSIVEGLGAILMDCSQPGNTTVWNIALSDEMAGQLALPEPEPTPLPEPVGPSKIGVHVTQNSDAAILAYVERAQPSVIVAVGDLGWLSEAKERSPETTTLGRIIEGDQSFTGDPVERARIYVDEHLEYYSANSGADYWLGWNEPVIDQIWEMEWFAEFEQERIRRMADYGLKCAIGNFSTGCPEADEFEAFLPVFAVAKEYGAILALHEYSAPTMFDGVGAGIPGLEASDGSGALTLRYRYWYNHYLIPNDLAIPLAITEAGIDGGVLSQRREDLLGWRDFQRVERLPEAMPSIDEDSYMTQLSWYDDELRRDEYVIGFAIFNVGGKEGDWASFDMTDMLPQLADLAVSKQ